MFKYVSSLWHLDEFLQLISSLNSTGRRHLRSDCLRCRQARPLARCSLAGSRSRSCSGCTCSCGHGCQQPSGGSNLQWHRRCARDCSSSSSCASCSSCSRRGTSCCFAGCHAIRRSPRRSICVALCSTCVFQVHSSVGLWSSSTWLCRSPRIVVEQPAPSKD